MNSGRRRRSRRPRRHGRSRGDDPRWTPAASTPLTIEITIYWSISWSGKIDIRYVAADRAPNASICASRTVNSLQFHVFSGIHEINEGVKPQSQHDRLMAMTLKILKGRLHYYFVPSSKQLLQLIGTKAS